MKTETAVHRNKYPIENVDEKVLFILWLANLPFYCYYEFEFASPFSKNENYEMNVWADFNYASNETKKKNKMADQSSP